MFYFPRVMKTHFCMCLSLSTKNTISLQCKWSSISVILNIFAQSICISLHVHNMIPLTNMADYNGSSSASSKHLLRSTRNEVDYVCKSCQDCESQLKEALDELSSSQMIITILQNELFTCKASAATCEVNLTTTEEFHNKSKTDEWTTTTHKNYNVKLQE